MSITTLTVAVTVAVLRLHHADTRDPPPTWLRILTYTILARITCLRIPDSLPGTRKSNDTLMKATEHGDKTSIKSNNSVFNQLDNSESDSTVGNRSCSLTIQREYRFIAVVIDKFFAGFFFLLFVLGSPMLLYICPVMIWTTHKLD